MTGPPPPPLLRALVEGPSLVSRVDWRERTESTNAMAAAAAARGEPEGYLAVADEQTAGHGRRGRVWHAPAGTSLLLSLLLRPRVEPARLPLLPLLTGLALSETVRRHLPGGDVVLKWPNDLLLRAGPGDPWRKAAGVLVQGLERAAVVGVGVNVDWRGLPRPDEIAGAVSLAEVAGRPLDRWRLLAGFVGVFGRWYSAWQETPRAFLPGYRLSCATIGSRVLVTRVGQAPVEGVAGQVDDDGALVVSTDDGGVQRVTAGAVEHVRAG